MLKLGYRIYVRIKELGLTQARIAQRSGLSQQIISNYINNKFKPGYDAILALARALEVHPVWFFDEDFYENYMKKQEVEEGEDPEQQPDLTLADDLDNADI